MRFWEAKTSHASHCVPAGALAGQVVTTALSSLPLALNTDLLAADAGIASTPTLSIARPATPQRSLDMGTPLR